MIGEFSFNGIDIADLSLEYAPEKKDTYVYGTGKYKIASETFDGHDGGYYYGATLQPKEFTLRCYYENENVNYGVIAKINSVFKRGTTGKLIFKRRPWVYYIATVTALDTTGLVSVKNGIVTITLSAFYPFGRTDEWYLPARGAEVESMKQNSGILKEAVTPVRKIIDSDGETFTSKSFMLYNGGTERAKVAVKISGDVEDGIIIKNNTTEQQMKFVAITDAITKDVNKKFVCDGLNGKSYLTNGTTKELAFLYHDSGFIDLEPSYPIERNVYVKKTNGSNIISVIKPVNFAVGRFVWLENEWVKITDQIDERRYYIEKNMTATSTVETNIVLMNEIEVSSVGNDVTLDYLEFLYSPTFA